MISGGEMSVPVHEIHDVRGLKRCMNGLHEFSMDFRQRFFLTWQRFGRRRDAGIPIGPGSRSIAMR